MDIFRLHAIPVGDLEELLQSAPPIAPTNETNAIEFYQGSKPMLLKPLPSPTDADKNTDAVELVPVNVMQFHTAMLPPNTTASIDGGGPPSEGFDRLADAEQVELFGYNVVIPSVNALEEAVIVAGHTLNAPHPPPRDAPCGALLFPSLLEGNITAEQWKALIRDGPMLDRIHYSYTVMLHFFGWRLHSEETGEVDRHQNWRARYEILNSSASSLQPSSSSSSSSSSSLRLYAVWTRMLRVLLELRMPNYVGRWMRFLLEEFKSSRLLFLLPVWDSVWFPYVGDGKLLFPETIEQLRKHRRKVDVHTSSDEDELLFGTSE
ncbi:Hypothetical protein, putative [Bodo saltans]|uniref:Opioid growth factor receptor (OGFr) conserved domain-containing protein n=1 Tax=Bodo saltans TaxID=75058 RepID=A0A0S4IQ25_BODSA|nr:Hypothetical protein, putative [Bodo saltans]|eukprot:CUE70863.1 Hypothetical protein, putative [Bodo saltans]